METTEEKLERLIESVDKIIEKVNLHSATFKKLLTQLDNAQSILDKRLEALESKSVITKQLLTKKTESVSVNKVYQSPTKAVSIPDYDGYVMFENQSVKSPTGYYLKPFIDNGNKFVSIDGKLINVRKVHAELHLIPSIAKNPSFIAADKESRIKSICEKHDIQFTSDMLV